MKVLMVTHPGLGHLHPLVPLARALQDAGYEVAIACAESFRGSVEKLGLRSFAAGLDWVESDAESYLPRLRQVDLERQPTWLLKNVFADEAARKMVPDLLALCRSWTPDLLVRTDYEFATFVVSELTGLPYATVGIEMALPSHVWTPQIGNQLAHLRSSNGLSPRAERDMFYRYLYLAYGPPGFQLPIQGLPRIHHLRPQNFDQSEETSLPAWAATLPSRPTVFATLGTVFREKSGVFRLFIEALAEEEINLIVAVGRGHDPKGLGALPPNFYVEEYVPMSLILPHCDLAITHAGHQTTLTALSHGLPMVAVPLTATDPLRARRCVDLGVGVALKIPGAVFPRGLDFEELTAESLGRAVRLLLADPSYRDRARSFQEEAGSLPGMGHAVELLAELAARRDAARHEATGAPRGEP